VIVEEVTPVGGEYKIATRWGVVELDSLVLSVKIDNPDRASKHSGDGVRANEDLDLAGIICGSA
jgi:hypothetical protein